MEKRWRGEAQIRNSGCEELTPEMRELKQEQWLRIAGVNEVLNEDKENAINGKQKDSVREETSAVPGTPPSEPPIQRGRSASRKKILRGQSPSGKFVRQPSKDNLKGICTNPPCDYWHPPECQFYKSKSGCKFSDKCTSMHRQVEDQPRKKPDKGW